MKSGEVEAAVGVDGLAGDEAAFGEHDGYARDFVHGAEMSHGKAVWGKRSQAGDHVGFD